MHRYAAPTNLLQVHETFESIVEVTSPIAPSFTGWPHAHEQAHLSVRGFGGWNLPLQDTVPLRPLQQTLVAAGAQRMHT